MTYQKQTTQKSPYAAKNGRKSPALDPSALLSTYDPPQCIESETALLSCMIQWPQERLRWSAELMPSDFYRLHHQGLFALLQEMTEAGDDVDAVTLLAEAKARGRLEDCGGTPYLLGLITADIWQRSAPTYARQIREAAARRTMSEGAARLLEASGSGASSAELAAAAESLLLGTPDAPDGCRTQALRSVLLALAQEVEDRAENPSSMLGLPTGFSSIDRITNGLQAPDMIVIGARPSVGKSALVTRIATNVALTGAPVLLMTLEMSAKQTATRMICAEARLSSHAFKAGRLSHDEWVRYNEASKMFYELPLDINDQGAVTPNYLHGEIRRSIKKHGRSPLVIVDYLQLMKADDATNGRYETVTALSIELKAICAEFELPMLVLSQLGRAVESRTDRRPLLGDVRESGQIEQDADIVAFLYREDMTSPTRGDADRLPDPQKPDLVPVELIFRKHRNGPVGTVRLDFVEQYALFLDSVDHYDNGGF